MTTLAPSLSRGGFARRLAFLEPSMALWLVLIAVLVFLIASPMVRLVIASFQEPDTGRFTFANYIEAYGSLRHLRAVLNSLELGVGVALLAGLFGPRAGAAAHLFLLAVLLGLLGLEAAKQLTPLRGPALVAVAVVYVALRSAAGLARLLKQNGIDLLSRVVGVLLAAIAVQLVATGIQEWVRHGA